MMWILVCVVEVVRVSSVVVRVVVFFIGCFFWCVDEWGVVMCCVV